MNIKRTFLLLSLSALMLPLSAQITIATEDAPEFGEVFANAIDTTIGMVDIGTVSAEAQVWSFLDFDADETFTNTVVMPSETTAADLFEDATFAFEGSNGLYSFAKVTADALLAAGGSAPGPNGAIYTAAFDPEQQLLALPSTYGTTFDDTFGYELAIDGSDFGADSVRISGGGTVSAEIDAFGEITVPAGTFQVLRQRSVISTSDSIYVKIFGSFILVDILENSTVSYEWWGKDGIGTVCSVDFDLEGNPVSATYLQAINPSDQAPVAGFTTEVLSGGQIQFTDASTNAPLSWVWDFGDGNTSTVQNPTHTYDIPGTYTVCLTATNTAGSNSVCEALTIVLPPVAGFTFEDQDGGTIAFTDASGNAPVEWSWDFGDSSTSNLQNPVHTYTTNGTYEVCLTVTNGAGMDVSCQSIMVIVVSTDELPEVNYANAYPSPAEDWLRIDFNEWAGQNVTITAFGVNGQQLMSRVLNQAPYSFEVNVSEWAAGTYFLRIDGEVQSQTLPVVVK